MCAVVAVRVCSERGCLGACAPSCSDGRPCPGGGRRARGCVCGGLEPAPRCAFPPAPQPPPCTPRGPRLMPRPSCSRHLVPPLPLPARLRLLCRPRGPALAPAGCGHRPGPGAKGAGALPRSTGRSLPGTPPPRCAPEDGPCLEPAACRAVLLPPCPQLPRMDPLASAPITAEIPGGEAGCRGHSAPGHPASPACHPICGSRGHPRASCPSQGNGAFIPRGTSSAGGHCLPLPPPGLSQEAEADFTSTGFPVSFCRHFLVLEFTRMWLHAIY